MATLVLAYCENIAAFFVDLIGGGEGDWDPKRNLQVKRTAIGFAVFAFYLLDFALNALQASLRNLLLDITPSEQLNAGNAWHSRMTQAGNIIGFGFGKFPPSAVYSELSWDFQALFHWQTYPSFGSLEEVNSANSALLL